MEYSLDRILADLLEFAAQQLALGGRLVYWLPVIRHNYKVTLTPACSTNYFFCYDIFSWDGMLTVFGIGNVFTCFEVLSVFSKI